MNRCKKKIILVVLPKYLMTWQKIYFDWTRKESEYTLQNTNSTENMAQVHTKPWKSQSDLFPISMLMKVRS